MLPYRHVEGGQEIEVVLHTSGCAGQQNAVQYLEHVELRLDMEYTRRGALAIDLTSPQGQNSTVA